MEFAKRILLPLILLGAWLGLCYVVRYQLMENPHWVAVCYGKHVDFACSARKALGVAIHYRVLARIALLFALPAFFLRGHRGRKLAWSSLVCATPALALYTVTPAAFAALIAGLRLVRDERHSAAASSAEAAAHPSA